MRLLAIAIGMVAAAAAFAQGSAKPLSGAVPRTPEGKPDLSGIWKGQEAPHPEKAALLPWAQEIANQRKNPANRGDNPAARCLPGNVLLDGAGVFKFVQTPALLVMMYQDLIGYRQVFLDARGHPKDWDPSWTGHSTGKWDRDTLVVDTLGFNARSWINLLPHTEMLHVVERYRRRDLGHLEVQTTIEDPGTFSRPWKRNNVWELAPKEDVREYVCNENDKDLRRLEVK